MDETLTAVITLVVHSCVVRRAGLRLAVQYLADDRTPLILSLAHPIQGGWVVLRAGARLDVQCLADDGTHITLSRLCPIQGGNNAVLSALFTLDSVVDIGDLQAQNAAIQSLLYPTCCCTQRRFAVHYGKLHTQNEAVPWTLTSA